MVDVGFKEIEVGFPSASETDMLLSGPWLKKFIPDDVTIQVLTQAREHILKKTFDSLDGIKNAIIGIYTPTSQAQRDAMFSDGPRKKSGRWPPMPPGC